MGNYETLKSLLKGGHGKQSRATDATTHVSPVHAQPKTHDHSQPQNYAYSDPSVIAHQAYQQPHGDAYSLGGQNREAQAGAMAAHHAEQGQKIGATKSKKTTTEELTRLVAEERETKNKLPRYPGLERWRLIEKMGDGAFSNVYRAVDNDGTAGEVAIKVVRKFEMNSNQGDAHLHPDFKKQPKTVERANILKEVQIMRQLDHPNIVKLVDFSESRQYYYIILELAPGGELFHQIVRLTYFSEDLARHVITQVAEALEYLHEEKGVVHRDIKPENLLFSPIPFIPTRTPKPRAPGDEDKVDEGEFIKGHGAGGIGKIKIADFGLSKIVWDSQTMTPCGTVGYTAPEIVKDERYSKSVDMWAMGCVLYTLLCGFPPFYDESIQVLTEKVARGQYTFLSPWWDEISKPAQDLVSHLLTVDPEKRFTIQQLLAHPWIRQSDEPTYAAHDAPPLATPAIDRNRQIGAQGQLLAFNPDLLESPGAKRSDFRSPGAVNLREVFDVGYAVHRQEEEAKHRKNARAPGLNMLNEDDDYEEYDDAAQTSPRSNDIHGVEQGLRNTNLSGAARARQAAAPRKQQQPAVVAEPRGYGQHSAAVTAAAKQQVRQRKGAFELNMDGATLLGRRGKNLNLGNLNAGGVAAPSGLRQEATAGGH